MEPKDVIPPQKRHPIFFAIASLLLSCTPLMLLFLSIVLLSFAFSGVFGDVIGGAWALFMIMGLAAIVISLAAYISAVVFGILAIRKCNTFFSWLGIIIVLLQVLLFAAIL